MATRLTDRRGDGQSYPLLLPNLQDREFFFLPDLRVRLSLLLSIANSGCPFPWMGTGT